MSNLNEMELQNLRHLIGAQDTTHCKLNAYAEQSTDPQVKQFFATQSQAAMQGKQQLMQFLS